MLRILLKQYLASNAILSCQFPFIYGYKMGLDKYQNAESQTILRYDLENLSFNFFTHKWSKGADFSASRIDELSG